MSDASPDPALESLKERGWREVAAINQALDEGRIDEDGWHQAMARLIKPSYLAAESVYAQAGHGGDGETWQHSRGLVADALYQSGTFLDAGCANGILMESVHRWGAVKGLLIEPYGLEIIPEFADRARQRYPQWANRIFEGNIRDWRPQAAEFDYVLIRPEYAPASRRLALVHHVLKYTLRPAGRLIVFVGVEERENRAVESAMTDESAVVRGRVEIEHERDPRLMRRLFWIDND